MFENANLASAAHTGDLAVNRQNTATRLACFDFRNTKRSFKAVFTTSKKTKPRSSSFLPHELVFSLLKLRRDRIKNLVSEKQSSSKEEN